MDTAPSAITRAVEIAKGQSALARALSTESRTVRQGHVWAWLHRDGHPPAEHCPSIESLTGVRCEELRPDLVWTRDQGGAVTGYHVPLKHIS